jgi:hypothetical protein
MYHDTYQMTAGQAGRLLPAASAQMVILPPHPPRISLP